MLLSFEATPFSSAETNVKYNNIKQRLQQWNMELLHISNTAQQL